MHRKEHENTQNAQRKVIVGEASVDPPQSNLFLRVNGVLASCYLSMTLIKPNQKGSLVKNGGHRRTHEKALQETFRG